jgi:hypothetical protein
MLNGLLRGTFALVTVVVLEVLCFVLCIVVACQCRLVGTSSASH